MKKLTLFVLMMVFCTSILLANTYKNGIEAFEAGDYIEAEKMFRDELAQVSDEGKPVILSLLSKTYFKLGETGMAAETLFIIWNNYPNALTKEDRKTLIGLCMYVMADFWEKYDFIKAYNAAVLLRELTLKDSEQTEINIAIESYLQLYIKVKQDNPSLEDRFLLEIKDLPKVTYHNIKTGYGREIDEIWTETIMQVAIWDDNIIFVKCFGDDALNLQEGGVVLFESPTRIVAYYKQDILEELKYIGSDMKELINAKITQGVYKGITLKNGIPYKIKLNSGETFNITAFLDLCELFGLLPTKEKTK